MNKDAEAEIERLADEIHIQCGVAYWDSDSVDIDSAETALRAAMLYAYKDSAAACDRFALAPHTYASENTDRYLAFADGAQACRDAIEARAGLDAKPRAGDDFDWRAG